MDLDEARRIMDEGGLGKAELEFAYTLTSPIWWISHIEESSKLEDASISEDGCRRARNGSTFFLNTGSNSFGVTAAHVIKNWQNDISRIDSNGLRIGSLMIEDIESRLIDLDEAVDIATYRISDDEIRALNKTIFRGSNRDWPPTPPELDKGIFFSGYPLSQKKWIDEFTVEFGGGGIGGVATRVKTTDVECLIQREYMFSVVGKENLPSNFQFGGMSGGPMLTVVDGALRTYRLAGIIYQGPNSDVGGEESIEGFDLIRVRRPDFIRPDGSLDRQKWDEALNSQI